MTRGPGRVLKAGAASATVALAAVLPAALWAVALWDRTTLAGMSRQWAATFAAGALALLGWVAATRDADGARVGLSGRGALAAAAGLLPAALLSAGVVAGVYLDERVHHAFVYRPALKGVALPLVGVLCLGAPALARGWSAARGRTRGDRPLRAAAAAVRDYAAAHVSAVVRLTLLAAGLLEALAFRGVATDDLIRYWAVADGLATGAGYPVTTGSASAGGFYLVELPLYPLLLTGSFALFGHRFLALLAPLIVAHAALPLLLYALALAAGARRGLALWLALAALCLPYYQLYALGAPEPEPLFAAQLALLLWLVMRLTPAGAAAGSGPRPVPPVSPVSSASLGWWLLLGLTAAAAVLTRPEGVVYVAPLALGLAWHRRQRLLGAGPLLAVAAGAAPVLAFSAFLRATFGIVWPSGWANVAGPQYVLPNLGIVAREDLPHYAKVAGLPLPWLTGPLLFLALAAAGVWGLVLLWRAFPALRFIPVALALNLGVILSSPSALTPDLFLPDTFFRHLSVLIPWLIPAYALALESAWVRLSPPRQAHEARRPAPTRPALAAAGLLALGAELAVVGSSTARDQAKLPTALSPGIYVLVTDLARAGDALPRLPFLAGGNGAPPRVDPAFDYRAFRDGLFARLRPYDLHAIDDGRAYPLAVAVVAAVGLLTVAVCGGDGTKDGGRKTNPSSVFRPPSRHL